jgi:hypothetical protein
MDFRFEWLLVVFVLILGVVGLIWHSIRSRALLERWAELNGYRIIDADYRNVFRGPFFWTTTKGQTVYRVTVELKGDVLKGWVRCGSRCLGLLSDRVEVRWDEAPAKAASPLRDRWLDG